MKRIISLTLTLVMLLALCLSIASCGMESMTGYTRLRDHIKSTGNENNAIILDAASVGLNSAAAAVMTDDDGQEYVCLVGYAINQSTGVVYQVKLFMSGSPEKAELTYEVINGSTGERISTATTDILLTKYTGSEFILFETVENILPTVELTHRQNATAMLNNLFIALDNYTTKNLDMDMHGLGFIALSEKYMADVEKVETEEDLGGFFSPARVELSLLMVVQGLGMVFLVLAILWLVLVIFKKALYKDTPKEEKKPAPAPEEAPTAPVAPATDDAQLVAVITAAIAAAIESDPALSSQFASGFRVVSFKKKNGKASWNQ